MTFDPTLHLYLDDIRNPTTARPWIVVRDVASLETLVRERGFPGVVSLDHDLGDGVPSGMDATHFLVEFGQEHGIDPDSIEFNVHSANPVGARNMRALFESWRRFHARSHSLR